MAEASCRNANSPNESWRQMVPLPTTKPNHRRIDGFSHPIGWHDRFANDDGIGNEPSRELSGSSFAGGLILRP
jgi:hypothetical protein